jgi:predicted SnoaL-like aldol condensation-catalyzing enzyme
MKTPLRTAMACILAVVAAPIVGIAADTPQEAANKQLVLDYYRDIEATMAAGKMSDMRKLDAKYRDPSYIQHSVHGQGGPGTQSAGGGPPKMGPPKLLAITAEGDKVIQVTSRSITDPEGKANETIIFNMFRVKNGKLIEHWDAFGVPAEPPSNSSAPK